MTVCDQTAQRAELSALLTIIIQGAAAGMTGHTKTAEKLHRELLKRPAKDDGETDRQHRAERATLDAGSRRRGGRRGGG